MDYSSLKKKCLKHYSEKLPFVVYSLPESDAIEGYFQNDNQLHTTNNLSKTGFAFASFEWNESVFYIPENESIVARATIEKQKVETNYVEYSEDKLEKEKYISLLNQTLDVIKNRKAVKIVLSRYKDIKIPNFNIEVLIEQLFSLYPTAFRYIWYHPEIGLWCGATPEILVKTDGSSFSTMALAGTQEYNPEARASWSPKEIDEQQLVTDYITNNLQKVTSVLKVSKATTQRAGSLVHLCTHIIGMLKHGKTTLTTIADALHPTPAICGSPQKIAKQFILKNEGYDREFYTGFLGPISERDASSLLMVNLRCMKIENGTARVYAGGGITIASNPMEEWKETQNKMQTMLQVLRPML